MNKLFTVIVGILLFPARSFAQPNLLRPPAIAIDDIEYKLLTHYWTDSGDHPNYDDELVLRYRVKINALRDTVVIDLRHFFEKQGWKVISDSGTKHIIRGRDWTIEEVRKKARTSEKIDVKKPFIIQYTVIPEEPLYITRNGYGLLNVPYGGRDYGYKIENRDEYLEKNKHSKNWDRVSSYDPPFNRTTIKFDSVERRIYSNVSGFFPIPYGTSAQTELNRNGLKEKKQSYFKNYIYLQVWGHSWYSLNYFRYLESPNILIGGGFGATPDARNFTLEDGGGGVIIQLYIDKQFKITQKFQYGFGIGVTHDFAGPYENVLDPFYLKTSLNRYSTSLADDRLYFGASLYYINWVDWSIRPSIKIGISF